MSVGVSLLGSIVNHIVHSVLVLCPVAMSSLIENIFTKRVSNELRDQTIICAVILRTHGCDSILLVEDHFWCLNVFRGIG